MAMVLNSPTPTGGEVQTVTFKILQGSHDGYVSDNSSGISAAATQLISNHSGGTLINIQAFALLTASTIGAIPQGTTIKSATLRAVYGNTRTSSPPSKMSFEPTDNPAVPSSKADVIGRTRGSIYTFAPPTSSYVTGNVVEIDLTSRVQTMVSRAGWVCNKLLWLWDYGAPYDGTNTFVSFKSFDASPTDAPYLVVEW